MSPSTPDPSSPAGRRGRKKSGDTTFLYRGLKFHQFFWNHGRARLPKWTVYISQHDYQPTPNFPGRQGSCTFDEGHSLETSAEIALERFNRRLIEDGEVPFQLGEP